MDPSRGRTKRHLIEANPSPLTKIEKMLKMKGDPDKLMKTKGQIYDKMAEVANYLKTL